MCNPILQARLLNRAHTDLNVVIGLCVGHDSLFYKYADAYSTTLITKTASPDTIRLLPFIRPIHIIARNSCPTINKKDMIQEFQLRALPEQAISEQALKQFIGREKDWTSAPSIPSVS